MKFCGKLPTHPILADSAADDTEEKNPSASFSSSAGPINISTTAVLVSPGVAVPGQISITSSEVYFEVDEDHDDYKKIDAQVGHDDAVSGH